MSHHLLNEGVLSILQDGCEKVFVCKVSVAVALRVILLEGSGESLDQNYRVDKAVELQRSRLAVVEFAKQNVGKLGRELISHRAQRLVQFLFGNVSRSVLVELVERFAPLSQILPQVAKFVHVDSAGIVPIEHSHHQMHNLNVKRRVVVVAQRLL